MVGVTNSISNECQVQQLSPASRYPSCPPPSSTPYLPPLSTTPPLHLSHSLPLPSPPSAYSILSILFHHTPLPLLSLFFFLNNPPPPKSSPFPLPAPLPI